MIVAGLIGFVAGAAIAYVIQEMRHSHQRVNAQKLRDEIRLAAASVFTESSEQFLQNAIKDLRQVKTEADRSLDSKKLEISHSVDSMRERLDGYQKTVQKFEQERFEMYGKLERSLTQVLSAEQSLRAETSALKRVLTSSAGVRGQWGERVLLEILEQNDLRSQKHTS